MSDATAPAGSSSTFNRGLAMDEDSGVAPGTREGITDPDPLKRWISGGVAPCGGVPSLSGCGVISSTSLFLLAKTGCTFRLHQLVSSGLGAGWMLASLLRRRPKVTPSGACEAGATEEAWIGAEGSEEAINGCGQILGPESGGTLAASCLPALGVPLWADVPQSGHRKSPLT